MPRRPALVVLVALCAALGPSAGGATLSRKKSAAPSWSRDGKRVAFSSGGSIYVVKAFWRAGAG